MFRILANIPVPDPEVIALRRIFRIHRSDRFLALIDQAAVSATNMLTAILVGRTCPKEELGLYGAGVSLVFLAFSFQKSLIVTPFTVIAPQTPRLDQNRYRGSSLGQSLAFGIVTALALAIAGSLSARVFDHAEVGGMLKTLAAAVVFIILRDFARTTAFAELRFCRALALDVSVAVLQLSGVVALILTGALTAQMAFVVVGLACATASIGWLVAMRREVRFSATQLPTDVRRNWVLGRWLFSSGILGELSISLYPWLIIYMHGTSEAGTWAACVGVVALYNPIMLAVYNETGPRIAHSYAAGGAEALRASVFHAVKRCSRSALPFLIILLVFGGRVAELVYGVNYAGNGIPVGLLSISAFVLACGFAFPYGLLALGRPRLDFAGNAAAFVVLLVSGLWLVANYGVVGAALGVLTANVAAVLFKASGYRYALKETLSAVPSQGDVS